MDDRRVHASTDKVEVVRYDRAGRWYIEWKDGSKRQRSSITEAVQMAVDLGATHHEGVPGGGAFDRKYHAAAKRKGRR